MIRYPIPGVQPKRYRVLTKRFAVDGIHMTQGEHVALVDFMSCMTRPPGNGLALWEWRQYWKGKWTQGFSLSRRNRL